MTGQMLLTCCKDGVFVLQLETRSTIEHCDTRRGRGGRRIGRTPEGFRVWGGETCRRRAHHRNVGAQDKVARSGSKEWRTRGRTLASVEGEEHIQRWQMKEFLKRFAGVVFDNPAQQRKLSYTVCPRQEEKKQLVAV